MARHRKPFYERRLKPGTAPGTLVAPEGAPFPQMYLMAWNEDDIVEQAILAPDDIQPFLKKWPVVWVNIDGLGSVELIEKMGQIFDLHPLALEDVMGQHQRPKTESYGSHLFVAARMARLRDGLLDVEQLSIFIGRKFVLTFQERANGDCLDPVRERIRYGKGRRIRFSHADYLGYALIDALIDGYFPVMEHYGDRLNALEDAVVETANRAVVPQIHDLKRDLRRMRQGMWPMRDMVDTLSNDTDIVREETRTYLRDCHDHIIQVVDILESYRETASSLIDIYLSSISNRTNEVMRVLTIISTIFIPLSFVASVYGMNFDMPEFKWAYGYTVTLTLMAAIGGTLLFWFWRKGWLVSSGK